MGDGRQAGATGAARAARSSLDALVARSYADLCALAARALVRESIPTLRPAALVHEIYLRLVDLTRVEWRGQPHLLAMAAGVARRALVDEARRRHSLKRDGGAQVPLEKLASPAWGGEVLEVDDLLRALASIDEAAAQVVGMRVFGGLSMEECAVEMEVSVATVNRKWRAGRTWLAHELAP